MSNSPDQILQSEPRWRAEELGAPLPDSAHANSVCLPVWQDVIGYEEKEARVREKLRAGYPRFVVPKLVAKFFEQCRAKFAKPGEKCMAYPSERAARRCVEMILRWSGAEARVEEWGGGIFAVVYPEAAQDWAMKYWRHTGDGISSRRAAALLDDAAEPDAAVAKANVKNRIASLAGVPVENVFLFPCGMAAIYAVYRVLCKLKPGAKTVQFGFPYVDSLKIQQDFGPGAVFLPRGDEADVKELQQALVREPLAGLFCEFPSNPLLASPDLMAVGGLCRWYDVPVVVDDTIATYANVNLLPACDVVVSSLTKFFTGRGDVLGGAVVVNTQGHIAPKVREALAADYEDTVWGGDALLLDEYSVDFRERMARINETSLALCRWLAEQPEVESVFYPGLAGRERYDAFRRRATPSGYSGLFSVVLKNAAETTQPFFDRLEISKGPNLGTTFSLACPFTMLAHFDELDWAESCGVSRYLIRFSVGLEPLDELKARFARALRG